MYFLVEILNVSYHDARLFVGFCILGMGFLFVRSLLFQQFDKAILETATTTPEKPREYINAYLKNITDEIEASGKNPFVMFNLFSQLPKRSYTYLYAILFIQYANYLCFGIAIYYGITLITSIDVNNIVIDPDQSIPLLLVLLGITAILLFILHILLLLQKRDDNVFRLTTLYYALIIAVVSIILIIDGIILYCIHIS